MHLTTNLGQQAYGPVPHDSSQSWEVPSPSSPEAIAWNEYSASRADKHGARYISPALSSHPSPGGSLERSMANLSFAAPIPIAPQSSFPTTPSGNIVEEEAVISISTSFCPGAHPTEHDIIFSSIDGVLFYVRSQMMTRNAPAAFSSFLAQAIPSGSVVKIPESSLTLNIILHTLHGTSCAVNSPSLDDLVRAVDCMPEYGIIPKTLVLPQTPLYNLLLSFAPLQPMTVYALAGHHDFSELAEQTSTHLLSYPLFSIDDDLAKRMGPVYLKRLFMLHWKRLTYLKEFILQPPPHHPPKKGCTVEDQNQLTRAWSLAAAYLVWDARPDLSTHMIKGAFDSLIKNITCTDCQATSNAKIQQVLTQWAAIKCTI